MSGLIHLAYASEAAADFTPQDVRRLLDQARKNNAALDVTGILLLVGRSFFQILEGESNRVSTLFEKIGRSPAHRRIVRLIDEPISKRDFANWSMGFTRASAIDLAPIPGFNDFFTTGKSLHQMNDGLARTFLNAFREGRFRAHAGD